MRNLRDFSHVPILWFVRTFLRIKISWFKDGQIILQNNLLKPPHHLKWQLYDRYKFFISSVHSWELIFPSCQTLEKAMYCTCLAVPEESCRTHVITLPMSYSSERTGPQCDTKHCILLSCNIPTVFFHWKWNTTAEHKAAMIDNCAITYSLSVNTLIHYMFTWLDSSINGP